MRSFDDLPQIEMSLEQIFEANQKANAPIKITRKPKNAAPASSPNAIQEAPILKESAPLVPSVSTPNFAVAAENSVPDFAAPSSLSNLQSGNANVVSRRKWGELWVPLALFSALIIGIGGGFLYSFAQSLGNLPFFVSLAVIGFGVGALMWPAIRVGKCRSVPFAVSLAVLSCVLVYVSALAWSGLRMRGEIIETFAPVLAKTRGIPLGAAREAMARRFTPVRAIGMYVSELNRGGITLMDSDKSRVSGSNGSGLHLEGVGFWAFWAFEIGLASLIAGGLANSFAKAPFHEGSGLWFRKYAAYAVHPGHVAPLLQFCAQKNWVEAGKLAKASKTGGQIGATATIFHLPGEGGFVRVQSSQNSGGKTLFEAPLSSQEVAQWKPNFTPSV